MLNILHKISKFILIFSAVISGWTSILLLNNTTSNLEIKKALNKMYLNQKDFIVNVNDLSLLLLQDTKQYFSDSHRDVTQFNNIRNESKKRF